MALTQIDFNEQEERNIEQFSKLWSYNKPKTIRRMVAEFQTEERTMDNKFEGVEF